MPHASDGLEETTRFANTGLESTHLQLVFMLADRGPVVFSLPAAGEVVIGRAREAQVCVDEPSLSRKHAVLRLGDHIELLDLGSANGTRVGSRVVTPDAPCQVVSGDVLIFGRVPALLREAHPEEPAGHPVPTPAARTAGVLERMRPDLERIAAGTISVLIVGETGVGKEVLAQSIHELSPRRKAPMVCLNCAAVSPQLFEAELFGHDRGAFTGATQAKPGLLESASGGTVFLDEVGDIPLPLQAKLLRALEQREIYRVGSIKPLAIDVRFISATNRDLESDAARGAFRRDLYFRLNGALVTLPPLRDRKDEVEGLAQTFVARFSRELGRAREPAIAGEVMDLLRRYPWPGNVRELRNVVERAVLLCTGDVIALEHVPRERMTSSAAPPPRQAAADPWDAERDSTVAEWADEEPTRPVAVLDMDDRGRVTEALEKCAGNQSRAAAMLGISRGTLINRLEQYGIRRPRKRT